jgi:hypothetical protein
MAGVAISASGVAQPSARRESGSLRRNSWVLTALLFVGGICSVAFRSQTAHFGSGFETVAVGRTLAEQGQFANPYSSLATGPTAHVAPAYPAFLGLLLWMFGYSATFALAASACSMLVHGLNTALLPRLSLLLFGSRTPGLWGAAMSIVLPLYFFFPQFEVIYFSAALMLFCLATHWLAMRGGPWAGLTAGLCFGAIALLNPASTTVAAPWLAYLAWRHRNARALRFLLFLALGFAVAQTPWTWRNYRQFHKLFFVRDNLGLELYVSNNAAAQDTFQKNNATGLYQQLHPDHSVAEAQECARLGEIEYNRRRLALAVEWMRSHPGDFLRLSAARARMFWFPAAEGYPWYAFGIALVTVVSFGGIVLLARRGERALLFLIAVQLLYPILYYLVQNDPRFRAPVLWISILEAGYLLAAASDAVSTRARRGATGYRSSTCVPVRRTAAG